MINLFRSRRVVRRNAGIRLDIGCGEWKTEGFVGLDKRRLPGVDIVWDIERTPWPLDDNSVVVAVASHILEHVKPWLVLDVMNELWRVCRPGAQVAIAVPYYSSPGYAQDPTHCTMFSEATWAYFDPELAEGELYKGYKPKPWKVEQLTWEPTGNMEVVLRKRAP